ncbi:MAG: MerR family transcriptional regulator [Nocardiopsaceae bacterium]|jgi:DNA-binding transcriptional MerR regulator|nr:MerR family transcriptional regulator [Nocardiopsaceae bacterium]
MAELSRRSGVPVATIKFYLRDGLLPPGTATAATRARYGDDHLRRLRLIRALQEIGGLPLAAIRRILTAVDDTSVGPHALLGAVQYALGPRLDPDAGDPDWQAAAAEVDSLLAGLGWRVTPGAPARTLLTAALAALRRAGAPLAGPGLAEYAATAGGLAEREVAGLPDLPAAGRAGLVEAAVTGVVLYEQVLVALRRLAQEDQSARRFGGG